MARTIYSLNSYTGAATVLTLSGSANVVALDNVTTSITLSGSAATWSPLGDTGGWYLAVDYGTPNEEKIYVPSGSWTYSNINQTFTGVTRGYDGTNAVAHSGGVICVPVITSTDISEANQLVSQDMNNFIVRSATATLNPGEWTVFSGTTAAQTLSLPSGVVNQTDNWVTNYSTQTVTIASGSNAQLNIFGTLGNLVLSPKESYKFAYNTGNTTWYACMTNDITALVGSGIAGQYLTPSGTGLTTWSNPNTYTMSPTYLSPYKAWTYDPMMFSTSFNSTSGTLQYTSIWVPTPMTLSGISFHTTVFAATATIYLGFFNSTTQLAVCSGLVGGVTGFRTALISGGTYYIATPGLYYIGLIVSGSSSPTLQTGATATNFFGNMNIGAQTNALTGLRSGTVIIGNRALYANSSTVSGSIAGGSFYPFFVLS